ncbi:MAG TPA: flagellar hook-basal body complex protein FliE [Candidatus Baltobacteraceae bacterium]|nr:flagellar hook-basal body complex protein FliE [Candidatus Baltobacteraceae bacterium]
MTVTPLGDTQAPGEPDAALPDASAVSAGAQRAFGAALLDALDATGAALEKADRAERAFAAGRGGLQEMVLERAQAGVLLTLASATASRAAQALTTLLGMQV